MRRALVPGWLPRWLPTWLPTWLRAGLLAALLTAAPFATAGSACEQREPDATTFVKAITLAEKTAAALDASSAQVALIARVGQDLSKYGLHYSHIAYVMRDHPKGRWTVVHELNECGTAHSSLYDQGLVNFFSDDLFAWESVILVPSTHSQERIVRMLKGDAPERLHEARYNMLSYAFGTTYQNSNQWVLETYAAAASQLPVRERAQAQAWLKLAGYAPITISIPAAIRLGARMFKANVAFDDHPFARRMTRQIDTVTVESMLKFVRRVDPGAQEIEVKVD